MAGEGMGSALKDSSHTGKVDREDGRIAVLTL